MNSACYLCAYLALLGLDFLGNGLLIALNLRHMRLHGREVPAALAGFIDVSKLQASTAYTRDRLCLAVVRSLAGLLLAGLTAAAGLYGSLYELVGAAVGYGFVQGPAFLLALIMLARLAGLPFDLYSQFVIEQRHGFNRMRPALFFADELKECAISTLLAAALLGGLLLTIELAGSWWWLPAWACVLGFQLVLSVLYPLLIAPLFNSFTPLADGPLKNAVQALAGRLGFRIGAIVVMDGSKRSVHSNAYFTGFGAGRRVVMFDTLVKNLEERETLAVLAHEIGHYRLRHLVWGFLLSAVLMLAGLAAVELVRGLPALYPAFGFGRPGNPAALLIAALFAGPLGFLARPAMMAWSRSHEFEADRYAARATGRGRDLSTALIKLNRDNLSNLNPHPWYSFFNYSHPTLLERIESLDILDRGAQS